MRSPYECRDVDATAGIGDAARWGGLRQIGFRLYGASDLGPRTSDLRPRNWVSSWWGGSGLWILTANILSRASIGTTDSRLVGRHLFGKVGIPPLPHPLKAALGLGFAKMSVSKS